MFSSNQWITWNLFQKPGQHKPAKVPTDSNGNPVDPHNPAAWTDYATASATGQTGFVFTEHDPYFFVDIDNALQVDGTWSETAVNVCNLFPGAYVEISHSGTGLHIIGQGVLSENTANKNSGLGLEVYDRLRFAAITGTGATGTPDINHQSALDEFSRLYMGERAPIDLSAWTSGPREDWRGPDDDNELIRRMLASRPGAATLFDGKAGVADLWQANAAVLVNTYPDGAGGYDASSADAALMQHLAFWTGCDCERMDRLFRRSGLMRDKYEKRRDYGPRTILRSVAGCRTVYRDPRAADITQAMGEAPQEITNQTQTEKNGGDVLPGTLRTGLQLLTADQQLKYFAGCVYVQSAHRVLTPDGMMLKPEQFKATYGGYLFSLDTENTKETKCPWEAFIQSRAFRAPRANMAAFRPERPPGEIISEEGLALVNIWKPAPVVHKQGDISPFLNHMQKLFPDPRDYQIIMAYLAACVQYPGRKFQWCPVIQGAEGNGKTLLSRAVAYAVGWRYSHFPNASDISNKFNAWIQGKLFIGVEEIHTTERREVIDALKPMITNAKLEIQAKGSDQFTGDNRANFIMNTNHRDAIQKTENDRRYSVFYNPQQTREDIERAGMGGDYFPNLYTWCDSEGYAIIAQYLSNYLIPDEFNPAGHCHRAPVTSTTGQAMLETESPIKQDIREAIESGRPGFKGGWISSMAFDRLLADTGRGKFMARNKRGDILKELGYTKVGRASNEIIQEGGKPSLFYLGYYYGDHATGDYVTAQGYAI